MTQPPRTCPACRASTDRDGRTALAWLGRPLVWRDEHGRQHRASAHCHACNSAVWAGPHPHAEVPQ